MLATKRGGGDASRVGAAWAGARAGGGGLDALGGEAQEGDDLDVLLAVGAEGAPEAGRGRGPVTSASSAAEGLATAAPAIGALDAMVVGGGFAKKMPPMRRPP